MIKLTEEFIQSAAPNADAIKNGRGLLLKKQFTKLHLSPDETLMFGYCQGSGREPYLCSADFLVPEKPVFRCNCPSRQFPCKHSIGLMFAFVNGLAFATSEIPEAIAAKREKVQERAEKKKINEEKPRQVNKSALAKKIKAQLDGIDLLEELTHDLVRLGIGNMNAKLAREIEEQAKQLGDAYLPGAQAALRNYTKLFQSEEGEELANPLRESIYGEALDQLTRLHALIGKGRVYLQARLADPELKPETETPIAAWLGHAWQLRELKEVGFVEDQVELIQLAFNTYDDIARQEYVDTGVWMNLQTGRIGLTQNFRPYKSVKHIKSDDSFFGIAQIKELFHYPGTMNPRIRWDGMLSREVERSDLTKVHQHARVSFTEVIKEVKNHIKSPLADKHPIVSLRFKQIGKVEGKYVVEDSQGERLVMADTGITDEPRSVHLLPLLPGTCLRDQTLIARFRHDLDSRLLRVKPLSIVTENEVCRLTL
jgi:hypothetical protein